MSQPIAVHPDNEHYFLFQGRPWFLLCATEHYGAVMNRRFDFIRYLDEAADKHQTLTRLFLLYREQQWSRNPYSSLKIEAPDYVSPFPRVGPNNVLDGEPAFDLDQWNPEFFDRLHGFVQAASDRDVVVECTLFSNSYWDSIWQANPLHHMNNVNGLPAVEFQDSTSLRELRLHEHQLRYVTKVVEELCDYDNLYYEVCNEPGSYGGANASRDEVDEWQAVILHHIRKLEAAQDKQHLVLGQQSWDFAYDGDPMFPLAQRHDRSYANDDLDAVNVHPLRNTGFEKKLYDLGGFMERQLRLENLREFCIEVADFPKATVLDEDNVATMYQEDESWTIHRKRAWVTMLSGHHYNMIDFSIFRGSEAGTEESRAKLRSWMRYLAQFMGSIDFIGARRLEHSTFGVPEHVLAVALALPGDDTVVYLADKRERGEPGTGELISGEFSMPAEPGTYHVRSFGPATGEASPAVIATVADSMLRVVLAPFCDDTVVRVTRVVA